jgi:hypothetical protein
MQCDIDCNITVEFIPAIMMGRGGRFLQCGWVNREVSLEEGRGFLMHSIRQFRTCSKGASLVV